MLIKFATLLLKAMAIALLFSGNVVHAAITVNYVGPDSAYTDNLTTGYTQCSRAEFNQPYGIVYWYVKDPGETGLGTVADIDYGDGTSTISYFDYTFNNGSTTGKAYEITAYVYPMPDAKDASVNDASYTVKVWTPFQDAVTVSKSVSDEMRVGDAYAFSIDSTTPNKNYAITGIKVYVDGSLIVSKDYDDEERVTPLVTGYLGTDVDPSVSVSVNVFGKIKEFAGQAAGKSGRSGGKSGRASKSVGKYLVEKAWEIVLRGTVAGYCRCDGDRKPSRDALDNKRIPYSCVSSSKTEHHDNSTFVIWDAGSKGGNGGPYETQDNGFYTTGRTVPFGYHVEVTLESDDLHLHGQNQEGRICEYKASRWLRDFGKVKWFVGPIPWAWSGKMVLDFDVLPHTVTDPCNP